MAGTKQRDLKARGWTTITTGGASNLTLIKDKRTIEIDRLVGTNENRYFCYDPEKIEVNILGWKNNIEKQKAIKLQNQTGWKLVYSFQNENKGIFIKKIRESKAA